MTCNEIDNRFKYHEPTADQQKRYAALRDMGRELAYAILNYCSDSREQSTALTRLDECIMHAKAAIERHDDPRQPGETSPLTVKSSIDSFNELRRSPAGTCLPRTASGTKIPHDDPKTDSTDAVKEEEAKRRARLAMRESLPLLIQFLVHEQTRLEKEGKRVNMEGILSLFNDLFDRSAPQVEKSVQGPQEHAANTLKVDKTASGFCIHKPAELSEEGVVAEGSENDDDDPYFEVGGTD
jgi:hypothetical protein